MESHTSVSRPRRLPVEYTKIWPQVECSLHGTSYVSPEGLLKVTEQQTDLHDWADSVLTASVQLPGSPHVSGLWVG